MGKNKTLTTNMNANFPLTPKWNLSLSGNFGYSELRGTINGVMTKNDGFTGYGYANTSYKFEREWRASATFNYSAPSVLLQGTSRSYTYLYRSLFGSLNWRFGQLKDSIKKAHRSISNDDVKGGGKSGS